MQKTRYLVTVITLIIIFTIILYIETGFNILPKVTTTVPNGTIIPNATTTTTIPPAYSCMDYALYANSSNTIYKGRCILSSNSIGIWVASGNASSLNINMVGNDGKTYINATTTYSCTTFFKNFTAPQQVYNITLTSGPGGGSCGPALIKFNSTVVPPKSTYDFVLNGNFTTGDFTGWSVSGSGFRIINVSHANAIRCYQGIPWNNAPGQFFASTYTCGTQSSPGNLTSTPFIVDKPFLDFRIISPQNAKLYIEILYNNATAIKSQYNTYNVSTNPNAFSSFRNGTIPMTTLAGKVVRIRVVAGITSNAQSYISIGGFYMSTQPTQSGNISNLTIYNTA